MTREELLAEIRRQERLRSDAQRGRNAAKRERSSMSNAAAKVKKKAQEIEDGLQETSRRIDRALERVNRRSKIRVIYRARAREFLFNSKSNAALLQTRQAYRDINKDLLRIDDNIAVYNSRIRRANSTIEYLKRQLNLLGEQI